MFSSNRKGVSEFIGYTYKETKCYADPFTKHFREQLNIDASKIGEKINQKIEKLGLWNLSFYIYIIPFNSVEEEFKEFLKVQDL